MPRTLTIFTPAYNEAASIVENITLLHQKITALGIDFEMLLVNDGSRDATGELAEQLAARLPGLRVVHHPQNAGIGAAFMTAIANARGNWMILIPADLALAPDEIRKYIAAATEDVDLVIGLRSDRSDYTLARKLVSWVNITLLQALFDTRVRQFQYISMYRLAALAYIQIEYWRSAFFLAEIIIKLGALGKPYTEVEITYAPRVSGKATGAKLKLIYLTVRDILRFWVKWRLKGPRAASLKP